MIIKIVVSAYFYQTAKISQVAFPSTLKKKIAAHAYFGIRVRTGMKFIDTAFDLSSLVHAGNPATGQTQVQEHNPTGSLPKFEQISPAHYSANVSILQVF